MNSSGLLGLITKISDLLNAIIPVLILAAVVWFIFGIIKYVIANTGEEKTKGVHVIVSGIIGLTVIVSMWALVGFLKNTFGVVGNNTTPYGSIPCIPNTGGIGC